jgi:hypothetical protein
MPQIGKYKYKFRTEILCGALWGECILIIYWQGWIYWGVRGVCTPLALAKGGAIFHDKAKKY